jgi:phosphopantetheinyl transferase
MRDEGVPDFQKNRLLLRKFHSKMSVALERIQLPNIQLAYCFHTDYEQQLRSASKKVVERNAIEQLLTALGFKADSLHHHASGQPFLDNQPDLCLSISHSQGWFALAVSSLPIGVDIQVARPRIQQGRDYFCNARENHFSSLTELHLIWGVKEAYFKRIGGNVDDLKDAIQVVSIENGTVLAKTAQEDLSFNYFLLNDAYLVVG